MTRKKEGTKPRDKSKCLPYPCEKQPELRTSNWWRENLGRHGVEALAAMSWVALQSRRSSSQLGKKPEVTPMSLKMLQGLSDHKDNVSRK